MKTNHPQGILRSLKRVQAAIEASASASDWNTLRLHEQDRHQLLGSLGDVEIIDRPLEKLLIRIYWHNRWINQHRPA